MASGLAAAANAFLAWLTHRAWGLPTVTRSEVLFTPLIAAALLCHVHNHVVNARTQARVRHGGLEADLGAAARERSRRSGFGVARLTCWAAVCAALLVNWPYANVVFVLGVLAYGVLEAVDAGLDWAYQAGRERYWQQRGAREAAETAAAAAVQRAERAAQAMQAAAQRIEVALAENTALTRDAKQKATDAYTEANTVNQKIASLGEHLSAERQQERLEQELPRHGEPGAPET